MNAAIAGGLTPRRAAVRWPGGRGRPRPPGRPLSTRPGSGSTITPVEAHDHAH